MKDLPSDAKRGRLGFLLGLICIAGGSILILFPAWLPSADFKAIGEDSAVELLQLALLLLSSILYFAAAPHAGRLKPIFFSLGLGALCGAIGEYAGPLEALLNPIQSEWIVWPIFVVIAWKFIANFKAFSRFWGYASRRPAAGFLLAGFIMAYVFGGVFGSDQFWDASLDGEFNPQVPKIVESYLELLACYFIFVSSIGFCLPVTKRSK